MASRILSLLVTRAGHRLPWEYRTECILPRKLQILEKEEVGHRLQKVVVLRWWTRWNDISSEKLKWNPNEKFELAREKLKPTEAGTPVSMHSFRTMVGDEHCTRYDLENAEHA